MQMSRQWPANGPPTPHDTFACSAATYDDRRSRQFSARPPIRFASGYEPRGHETESPMPSPALIRRDPPGSTRGIVLMLHGGAKTGLDPVTGRSLSLRRTTAMRDVLTPHVLSEGFSVWLLRFGVRGWNADPHAG